MLESKEPFGIKVKDLVNDLATKYVPGFMRHQVHRAGEYLVAGSACLVPNETIYTIAYDGNRLELVKKMRGAKGRQPDQREALAFPPQEFLKVLDLRRLKEVNPGVDENTIFALKDAHPRLGIVFPCLEDRLPAHLITPRKIEEEIIPTALWIWNPKYPTYAWLWEVVSRYPGVLLVATSANIGGEEPTDFLKTRRHFARWVPYEAAVKDFKIETHPRYGSYPIVDFVSSPPRFKRSGNLPLEGPNVLENIKRIVPSLVFP